MQESSQTRIYTQMQAKPETRWDRHRMLSVCTHGAKSREDNEEQTQLSLVNVCMRVRCCVNALHFLTSLRAEVAERIIRHSLNLSDWPHDRWKQSIPTKWCMITITGRNPGQHPAHLWPAGDVQLWQSHLAGIACSSQSAPENLWYCRKKNLLVRKSEWMRWREREIQTWDTGAEAEVYMFWRFPFINW